VAKIIFRFTIYSALTCSI